MISPRRFKSALFVTAAAIGLFQNSYAAPYGGSDAAFAPTNTSGVHLSASSRNSDDSNHPGWAKFASHGGDLAFLAAGTLLPLAMDGKAGQQHSLRIVDALLASTAITTALKYATNEQRPDGSDNRSFPSGHASAAFTIATMEAHYHPRQALLWYGGATVIGVSRVALDKHYWHDVVAGAALGYFTAKLELKQKNGFLLRPFIHKEGPANRVMGLSLTRKF